MNGQQKAVVLLSGGLDSATVLAIARDEGFAPHALSFRYGQRHEVELEAAGRVAAALGAVQHVVADIDLRVFGGSALTADTAVPHHDHVDDIDSSEIPITYVPARNTIFLSFALAWAETLNASDVFIGVNALDYSGYPDCRPEYIAAYEQREAVRRQALDACLALADLTAENEHAEALKLTRAAIHIDPYAEAAYRKAMALSGELGNLAAIQELRRDLTRRMSGIDAEPDEDTLALADRLIVDLQRRRPTGQPRDAAS